MNYNLKQNYVNFINENLGYLNKDLMVLIKEDI